MNERIEKLGEQADLLGDFTPTKIPGRYVGYITEEQILKFAELIVRECMNIVSNQTTLDTNEDFREGFNHGLKYAWTDIRKHFGVEE